MLNVNEMFVSFQGEGAYIGHPSLFIRLQGCNLACSWCDSKDSIRRNGGTDYTAKDIIEKYKNATFSNVVITGGEPLLQQNDEEFEKLIEYYVDRSSIEIETNGTIVPSFQYDDCVFYNVSPKLSHSGMAHRFDEDAIRYHAFNGSYFKFVVNLDEPYPFAEIEQIQRQFGISSTSIYVMAEGTTFDAVIDGTKKLMQMNHPYPVSTRSHILFGVK